MEQESDHKFDEFIHSELNDFRIEPTSEDQWERLYSDLDKAAVKSSYWKKFNIVYGAAIVVIIALVLYSKRNALFNIANNKSHFNNPASVKNTSDSSTNKNPVSNDPPIMPEGNGNIKTDRSSAPANSYRNIDLKTDAMDTDSKKQKVTLPEQAEVSEQVIPEMDSIITIKAPGTNETKVEKAEQKQTALPKPKKIRYITKRDTLVVVDTAITKKKR